jgi:C-terminal processing protease CtpA/Prc
MNKNSFIVLWLLAFGFSLLAEELGVPGFFLIPVKISDRPCQISTVMPGSPADRAGIKADWFLISIDGTNVVGMSLVQCGDMLRGSVGAKVTLELADSAMSRTNKFTVRRAKMVLSKKKIEFSDR